jgi:hypothetical protein
MSKLYFEKNLLLQSLTLLFESALAFLENRSKIGFKCEKKHKNSIYEFQKVSDKFICKRNRKKIKCDFYQIRNCIKSKLFCGINERCNDENIDNLQKYFDIENLESFIKCLKSIDRLRNDSAHVFINGEKKIEDFKRDIEGKIVFYEKYLS